MTDLALVAGVSAFVAAVATGVGAVFLGLFFSKGQPWGTLNDLASIVLMIGTIPVALFVADVTGSTVSALVAGGVALVGIGGMAAASVAQGLLVLRVRTYEALLPWTLGAGAVVGVWYVLVGVTGLATGFPTPLAILAIVAGVGFVAMGYGFWRGNERHPASIAGGLVMLVASTAFLIWIGIAALAAHGLSR
ncbi:MAG: hypothetical protein FIA92_07640 [Chloroflexi bacterium]|nr:hypothetical protein [Chloroflexota bacterium]